MSWLKSLGQEATLNILDDLSTAYYFEKSSPGYYQLDQVYFLIKSRAWLDLLNYEVDYQAISTGEAIAVRQMLAFYEKLDCLPTGIDREAKAFEKFVEAEEACKATNDRFRSGRWRNFFPRHSTDTLLCYERNLAHSGTSAVVSILGLSFWSWCYILDKKK